MHHARLAVPSFSLTAMASHTNTFRSLALCHRRILASDCANELALALVLILACPSVISLFKYEITYQRLGLGFDLDWS